MSASTSSPSEYQPRYPYLFFEGFLHWVRQRLVKCDDEVYAWVLSPAFDRWFDQFHLDLQPAYLRRELAYYYCNSTHDPVLGKVARREADD